MKKYIAIALLVSAAVGSMNLSAVLGDLVRDTGRFTADVVEDTTDFAGDVVDDVTPPYRHRYYDEYDRHYGYPRGRYVRVYYE